MDSGIGYYSNQDHSQNGLSFFQSDLEPSTFTSWKYVTYKTLHALQPNGPYIFELGGQNHQDLISLKSLRLNIKFNITKRDGSILDNTDDVSFVNSIGHSLFENIGVKLNSAVISDHSRLYPFKAHIMQVFSFSEAVKTRNMNCEYYLRDDQSVTTAVNNACKGYIGRGEQAVGSKPVMLSIVPYLDIMSSQNYLCPGHTLQLEFERSRSEFCLLSPGQGEYRINILDLYMFGRELTLSESLNATLHREINTKEVNYQITRNVIRSFQSHQGVTLIEINNIFSGARLPRALYFAFLSNAQISGTQNTNPYVFLHKDIRESYCTINGVNYPSDPTKYNFQTNEIMPAYRWFLDNIGIGDLDTEVGLDASDFAHGKFLIAFDLSPEGDNGQRPHKAISGSLNFTARLGTPLDQPITVLVYAVFENTIKVDNKNGVILDYQV